MSTDPLKCSQLALVDQADFTAQQLRTFAREPLITAAFPRWFGSLEDRAQALAELSKRCLKEFTAAEYARDTVDLSYRKAKPALAAVKVWAAALRKALEAAEEDPEGRRLAGQVRGALRGDLRRVTGTVAMLQRAVPLLESLTKDLSPWLDTPEQVATARPHLATLLARQAERGTSSTESVGITRGKQAIDAELRTMMRRLRRDWSRVEILSGGRVPSLNLVYAASDVANQPAKRAARKAAQAAKAEEAGRIEPEGAQEPGNDSAQDGSDSADVGVAAARSGAAPAEAGDAVAGVGNADAEVGVEPAEVGAERASSSRAARP